MDKLSTCIQNKFMRLILMSLFLLVLVPTAIAQEEIRPAEIPETYEFMAENELFQVYFDASSLAFKLIDKRSGYLWHSGLDETIEGDRLNTSWRAFAKSGISIEYFDRRGTNTRVSIANANHNLVVNPIEHGISAIISFLDFGITLEMHLQLENEGLRVEIPSASIREENPDYRLAKVYVYPFFGASRGSSIDGYMFLPDGIGSIVRFADTSPAQNMFYGRYYGTDLGILAEMPYDDYISNPIPISLPVFGIVHGEEENAFFSVIEQGASYGEVNLHPAGIITNFNFIFNAFIYNQTYFQATNRSGAGVTTVTRQTNQFDVVMHYRFLTGDDADYVGMAHSYQDYLLQNGNLRESDFSNPNIAIRLEFLGGDKEKVLLWDSFVPMTTISQMSAILDDLQIPNAEVIYYGWQPLGASNMPPLSLEVESGLGSLNELTNLAARIETNGGHFSLFLAPQVALWQESGYSTRNDIAMAVTNVPMEGFGRSYHHYFSLNVLQERYLALSHDIANRSSFGLALDGIGSMLYSDYREGQQINREESILAYQNLLADSQARLSFYRPNDYVFGLAEAYYDMPLGNNSYIFSSEPVPFLPIVLSGYIPYYGTALNFSSDIEDELLRHVEYGIYPSYFLSQEATANMLNTRSIWLYTSSYAQWGDDVRTTYDWMNSILAAVRGQAIVEHRQLARGVYATSYANGMQIIVNYNEQAYLDGDIRVEAKDAVLLENQP